MTSEKNWITNEFTYKTLKKEMATLSILRANFLHLQKENDPRKIKEGLG